jgi:1-acyl-sn-glycerol-3-phosphate acyltransferase
MVYWLSYYFFKFVMTVFFRGKCYGKENLPQSGPYIAVINHNSLLDVPAAALAVRGRVSAMVKDSLFEVPVLGWWLKTVNMFPVIRGGNDQAAFKFALDLLKRGYVLYMAPEGTRKFDPQSPPRAHTGFIRLAQMASCPVVPIAMSGTREALPPGAKFPKLVKVKASIGKPIILKKLEPIPENYPLLQDQADHAMREVYRLNDELKKMDLN